MPVTDTTRAARSSSGRRTGAAASITAPGTVCLSPIAVPSPSAGQVRIRLEGCGVCGSNLPVWEGRPWFSYPLEPGAPGHEGWGVVDAVGDGVDGVAPGDRVAALSYHAFAEWDIADAAAVVRLPDALGKIPFPGEPLGCAMNVFRRSDIQAGNTVVVVGVGFLGAVVVALAAQAGARVIAISRRPFALEVARIQGAAEMLPLDNRPAIIERVQQLTAGEGADRVIEAVGLQEPLDLAGELTRVRGRLVIAGYHQDGTREVNMQLWNWRGLDVINAHERDPAVYVEGIRAAADAVATGRLDPRPLFTHTFSLDELGRALDTMRQRPDGFLKALVTTQ
ncbi:MAG TPA: zinc-binding dehydrogenase [Gemmatimonadales bacterium]|nr:zinc-binding dehydrogenase [Gemmatimonadales bacterium]